MSRFSQLTLLFSVLITLYSCQPIAPIAEGRPNIIMVFMDDMGYGDLSSYGHPTIKTPHLDAMADRGIRFTSFYAPAAVCTPSRSGLLTGKYPVRNARRNFGPESKTGLLLSETTIAEVLKGKGYKTAAIGKWHLGHQTEYLPTSRGLESDNDGLPLLLNRILISELVEVQIHRVCHPMSSQSSSDQAFYNIRLVHKQLEKYLV